MVPVLAAWDTTAFVFGSQGGLVARLEVAVVESVGHRLTGISET